MQIVYVLMVIAGLASVGWGFWASYNAKRPWDIIGTFLLPTGLVITLLGVLLTCVPNFFKG